MDQKLGKRRAWKTWPQTVVGGKSTLWKSQKGSIFFASIPEPRGESFSRGKATPLRIINGRQIALMMHSSFTQPEHDVQLLDFNDVLAVKIKNDNPVDFLVRWKKCLLAQREMPDENMLRAIFN